MNALMLPRPVIPVTVLLVAAPQRLNDLGRHLPHGWRLVRQEDEAAASIEPGIVVFDNADRPGVVAICRRYPGAGVIAVIGPFSDHNRVVEVLDAGADACVRSDSTSVLAAHVQACQRRQRQAA